MKTAISGQSLNRLRRLLGIGLLELSLVLAVVASVVVLATRYYESTQNAARLNDAVNQINGIINASGQYKLGQRNFDGLTGPKLVELGVLPSSALKTPWGGDMQIQNYGTSTVFIRFLGVPASGKVCKELFKRIKGKNIYVGGGSDCTFDYRETRD